MKRGDVFIATIQGDYGKPRPAVIVQRNESLDVHETIVICPISSHLIDAPLFRPHVTPSADNGLQVPSQIMVDKVLVVKRQRLRKKIGHISDELLIQLDRSLAFWLGL